MTNIFHKKDGLTDAVKSVMEVNQFHREAEAQVNEMFGVVSRKALPHEQQASWDAEFNKIISEGAMKRMSMGADGGMETYKKKPEEPEDYSPKQMMIAKIAGNPKKIDAQDLAALRAGKKMDEGEQIDEISRDLADRAAQGFADRGDKAIKKKDYDTYKRSERGRKLAVNKSLRRAKVPAVPRNVPMPGQSTKNEEFEQIDELNLSGVKPSANIEDRRTKGSRMDRPVSNQVTKSDQMKTPAMSKADRLDEKAVSKAQHRFFGLVRGIQKGEAKGSPEAEKAAKSMSVKSVRDYAKTKEKGLPEKIDEESLDSIHEEIAMNLYAELNYVMEQHGEEAGDEWIANLSEEQLAIMEAMSMQDYMNRPAVKNYMAKNPERSNRAVRGTAAIDRNAQAQSGMAQARANSTDAARREREANMAQQAREQGANRIRKTGPGFEQLRRNQPQDSTKTAPLAQTPRGYEGGGPAQKVDAKTMKSTASSPVQQAAKQALNNKPAAKAPAPAPVKKAKPAAPKPTFKANFKGGFGQRATQDTGPQKRGSDR